MKRILSTVILCALVGATFAQKKAVKEAKKAMESDKIADARQLIKPALTNSETDLDPETWKIAGDIEAKAFNNEVKKQMLGQTFNEEAMYDALYNMWKPYITSDSLALVPDQKGKIQDKYRKLIAPVMKDNHVYYINGGVFYNNKKDFTRAADYFERYWNTPDLKMFADQPDAFNKNDTIFQTVKYYASICAIQAKDHPRAIKFLSRIIDEPAAATDAYQEFEIYELLSNEYLQIGDSVKYIQVLEVGAEKFPKSKYFIPNLINEFIKKDKMDEALMYLDKAIANDPSNSCELYSVKASIYTQEAKYDDSFNSYEKALAADPNCERALDGLSVAYIINAQDLRDKATQASGSRKEQADLDKQANDLYKKAYPLLEKLRSLIEARSTGSDEDKTILKSILYKLRNSYYNLNMNDEYDAVTKAYEDLSN